MSTMQVPFPGLNVSVQQVLELVKTRKLDFGIATEILAASGHASRQHPEIHIMETGYTKVDKNIVEMEADWHVDQQTKGRPLHSMFPSAEASVDALIRVVNTAAGEKALELLSTAVGHSKPVYIYSRSASVGGDADMVSRTKKGTQAPEYPVIKIAWVVTGLVRGKKGDYLTAFTHYPVQGATMQDQITPPVGQDLIEYVQSVLVDDPAKIGKKKQGKQSVQFLVPVEHQK